MEVVAAVSSVVALVQLTDRIVTLCGKYASGIKNAPADIQGLSNEVTALRSVLKRVDELNNSSAGSVHTSISDTHELEKRIKDCETILSEIERKLNPGQRQSMIRRLGRRTLKWPFEAEEVAKLMHSLESHKSALLIILHTDIRYVV